MTAKEFIPKNECGMYSRNDVEKWAEKYAQSEFYSEEDLIKFMQFIISNEELENTSGVSPDTAKYYINKSNT